VRDRKLFCAQVFSRDGHVPAEGDTPTLRHGRRQAEQQSSHCCRTDGQRIAAIPIQRDGNGVLAGILRGERADFITSSPVEAGHILHPSKQRTPREPIRFATHLAPQLRHDSPVHRNLAALVIPFSLLLEIAGSVGAVSREF